MNKTENLLVAIMKECAEIQEAASNSFMFGFNNHRVGNRSITNAADVMYAYYGLLALMEYLQEMEGVQLFDSTQLEQIKLLKICEFNDQWNEKLTRCGRYSDK